MGPQNRGRAARAVGLSSITMKKLDARIGKKPVSDFRDVQFMTAKEKAGVARDFELFIIARLGMDRSKLKGTDYGSHFPPFTKRLYLHYSLHLGHIAHYDQWGFFNAQFEDTRDFVANLKRAADGVSTYGYSLLDREHGDLNKVMQDVARHYLPLAEALQRKEIQAAEDAEVEAAKALLTRKGILKAA
jgi:hypothetical protein